MQSLLNKRVAERTVWGGRVSMGMKLAVHTGAAGEKLPPPTAFSWRKTSYSLGEGFPSYYVIKLSGSKREVMMGSPVFLDFGFPNCSIEQLKRKLQLFDTVDTKPHFLFKSAREEVLSFQVDKIVSLNASSYCW